MTQALQFAEARFQYSCINRNLRNFIELFNCNVWPNAWILNKKNKRAKMLNKTNLRSGFKKTG